MALATFIAGEAIAEGDAVSVSPNGIVNRANSSIVDNASTAGVASSSAVAGAPVIVYTDSVYTAPAALYTAQEVQYVPLLTSGTLTNYTAWASGLSLTAYSGAYLTRVGTALSPSGLNIEVEPPIFINNPTQSILLEDTVTVPASFMLTEDGFNIDLEDATVVS